MSVLQTIDLKKYYGTEPNITRALDGVNFSVEDGEFVAVVGTSGSGGRVAGHALDAHHVRICHVPWYWCCDILLLCKTLRVSCLA